MTKSGPARRRALRGKNVTASRRKHTLSEVLGPLESEVMDVAWERGDVTVRDVHEALNGSRPVAYTTVMTTMGRLADKGLLRRVEDQRAHRFVPLLSRDQYADSAVKSVVDWLVTQFKDPAVAYFLDRVEKEDAEVIDALREAIDQRKRQRK
jgi:predicted transcriptional regulator